MRLLIVSANGHLPVMMSGQAVGQHELALALTAAGHEAIILAPMPDTAGRETPALDRSRGYAVWWARDVIAAFPYLLAQIAPDVVIIQSAPSIGRLMIAAREAAVPTLVYLHSVEMHRLPVLPPDPFFRYLAVSRFVADRMRVWHEIDCAVLEPLIDVERHRAVSIGDSVTFVNPTPPKGVELFFAIAEAAPELRYLVVESWDVTWGQRQILFERAARIGNIDWRFRVEDMRPVWAETRVLLAPSVWEEAWARVVGEAQASGIPALASTRGGLPESVGPGGILRDIDAPIEDWVAALRAMMNDTVLHGDLAAAARAHAARPAFQAKVLVDRLIALAAAHISARPT